MFSTQMVGKTRIKDACENFIPLTSDHLEHMHYNTIFNYTITYLFYTGHLPGSVHP